MYACRCLNNRSTKVGQKNKNPHQSSLSGMDGLIYAFHRAKETRPHKTADQENPGEINTDKLPMRIYAFLYTNLALKNKMKRKNAASKMEIVGFSGIMMLVPFSCSGVRARPSCTTLRAMTIEIHIKRGTKQKMKCIIWKRRTSGVGTASHWPWKNPKTP